jgi:hypothetical protein
MHVYTRDGGDKPIEPQRRYTAGILKKKSLGIAVKEEIFMKISEASDLKLR